MKGRRNHRKDRQKTRVPLAEPSARPMGSRQNETMRLGIFGGSFDPVHLGHLILAETCREEAQLDQVWFVPAATPPHKSQAFLAPSAARLEMLKLAIGGHPHFVLSTLELDRGGVSYTVDTLTRIHQQHPEAKLYFLMGADSLVDLPGWREPRRICQLAIPLVVRRSGSPPPDLEGLRAYVDPPRWAEIEASQVEAPLIQLSSTDLRRRIRERKSIRFRTPRAVEQYILAQQLYLRDSTASGADPKDGRSCSAGD
jgi:nicotinate-nucleotide adenylyltransferase